MEVVCSRGYHVQWRDVYDGVYLSLMIDKLEPVQEAIADGQVELARNLLRILIEDYPDNADVWYHAAQAAVNDNQRKAFLEKAVDLDPLHHHAANELHAIKQQS